MEYAHCYGTCPEGRRYLESANSKECMEACKPGQDKYYIKGEHTICATDCPAGHLFADGNQCVVVCPEHSFVQDKDTHVCVSACESRTYETDRKAGNEVCLKTTDKCGMVKEIVKINGEDYTHCLTTCSRSEQDNIVLMHSRDLCLTAEQCVAQGGYMYKDKDCLTGKECEASPY